MGVVNVLARLPAVADEVEQAVLAVDGGDPASPPGAAGDCVLELAVAAVQIEMPPPGPLAPPDHLVGFIDVADRLVVEEGGIESVAEQTLGLARLGVQRAELQVPLK